jgi:hypothetical protein
MLNAETLAHDVIEAKLLCRKPIKETAKRWAFGSHKASYTPRGYLAQGDNYQLVSGSISETTATLSAMDAETSSA